MTEPMWLSVGLVLLFILIGGVFAGTELALVSLRESQLDQLAKRGKRGAHVARVARDPNRFLAAVQIGVTVAGFISAAYGAATLAPALAPSLESAGLGQEAALTAATILLTLIVAYLSLVLGELVPKRFALQRAQGLALAVTPALDRFATAMRPVIWLLSVSTDAVVRVLGGDPKVRAESMSGEELRDLVDSHEGLPADARRIVSDVLGVSDRTVAEVLRHRADVEFVDALTPAAEVSARVSQLPYSRYPVIADTMDDVIGFLHVRDLLTANPDQPAGRFARPILYVPSTALVMPVLAQMRAERHQIAVVVDEHGGTDGIVTFEDLLEELVGEIADEYDPPAPPRLDTDGDSLDAGLTIEEFADRTGFALPDGPYETVAGFVMARLGRLARVGDEVTVSVESEEDADAHGLLITVAQVEGRRIRLVTVSFAAEV
ncbi:hemolysin family protein [Demequina sp. TTPB684]|uniref:hemolysin family protein n=1 Tax=unclassified Demequina TaxID=2620311 RepID=UPI001CF5712D|nr:MULTISPECIES: hemolysin family protein [unclassified Demequina]MCB2411987.1 hemolysin family protein [Demequina sp. TTPB684]UPU88452.1 hemolysin family protein [Demequina sp. TMPB413]